MQGKFTVQSQNTRKFNFHIFLTTSNTIRNFTSCSRNIKRVFIFGNSVKVLTSFSLVYLNEQLKHSNIVTEQRQTVPTQSNDIVSCFFEK